METATKGRERQMGKVVVTLRVVNPIDQAKASEGSIPEDRVRQVVVSDVLVDTGATYLSLPGDVVRKLGLTRRREVPVVSALGRQRRGVYGPVWLEVEGRGGSFDCLELPEGAPALLGFAPMEVLGLEPDLANQRLRLLPETDSDTHVLLL